VNEHELPVFRVLCAYSVPTAMLLSILADRHVAKFVI